MENMGYVALIFSGTATLVYALAIRATPGRGMMKLCEKVAYGVIVLYACNLVLSLFGLRIAQNPLNIASAGLLGIPGVAVSAILSGLP